MTPVSIKPVRDPPARGDGLRVLVEPFWPRGVPERRAALNLWARDLAPSAAIRWSFAHDPENWAGFAQCYRRELWEQAADLRRLLALAGGRRITLLFQARDGRPTHASVLRDELQLFCAPRVSAPDKPPSRPGSDTRLRRSMLSGARVMPDTSAPPRPGTWSATLPEALESRLGHDLVLQWLIREELPLTVKNCIDANWMGEMPEELDEEDAAFLQALADYATAGTRDGEGRLPDPFR